MFRAFPSTSPAFRFSSTRKACASISYAPLGRTLLYELASRGEIQSASLGLKRGKRVFVTASIVAWLRRRTAATRRPKVVGRHAK